MFGVFGILVAMSLCASLTPGYLLGCLVILAILGVYAWRGWRRTETAAAPAEGGDRAGRILTAGFALAFFAFVSLWTGCRVLAYRAPTYDFGIFSQMFHQMRTTGLPVTTVERDGALSHFAVHVSPIYYLLLPFYWICPRPVTLQVLQGGRAGVCGHPPVEALQAAWLALPCQRRDVPAFTPVPGICRRRQL